MTLMKKFTFLAGLLVLAGAAPAGATSIGWGNLQFPMSYIGPSCSGVTVFGRVWLGGVTDSLGQGAGITAELGFGPTASVPDNSWVWLPAVYNVDVGNNDEYMTVLSYYLAAGIYDYTFRYQYAGDNDWYVAAERGVAAIIEGCGAVDTVNLPFGSLKAMYGGDARP